MIPSPLSANSRTSRSLSAPRRPPGHWLLLLLPVVCTPASYAAASFEPPRFSSSSLAVLSAVTDEAEPPVMSYETRSLGQRMLQILSLRDYNTRLVLLGTSLLGFTAGVVGTFMLLRRRALIGDVVGHSALPGIAIAFLTMEIFSPGSGKSLPGLLLGAFASGLAGAAGVMLIDRYSRIKADAAMAIVLSVFYGLGAALFTVVQRVPSGNAAGLKSFLNGKAAALVAGDVGLFAAAAVVVAATLLMLKELSLLCFDDEFAAAQGWPVRWMDTLLIGLVVAVTIIGMQSVGLILVVATLIIPPAAARFWTDDLRVMTLLAGFIGGLGAFGGTFVSALFERMATGAVIVLSGTVLFIISLCLGRKHGLIIRQIRQARTRRNVERDDLLRGIYELQETQAGKATSPEELAAMPFGAKDLVPLRAWDAATVKRLLRHAARDGLLVEREGHWRLTPAGATAAQRRTRNHRLWEMYLMRYADIAPSHVDRDADLIEHVLDPELVAELESSLDQLKPTMPDSFHAVTTGE